MGKKMINVTIMSPHRMKEKQGYRDRGGRWYCKDSGGRIRRIKTKEAIKQLEVERAIAMEAKAKEAKETSTEASKGMTPPEPYMSGMKAILSPLRDRPLAVSMVREGL